jgi:hypothetical protein
MNHTQSINTKLKFKFDQNKRKFSEILKNMGKNIMREIFLIDRLDNISKGEFRRLVEAKVKSFLGHEYVDFDNIGHIHLFEKMKMSINNDPTLNRKSHLIETDVMIPCEKAYKGIYFDFNKENIDNLVIGNNLTRVKVKKRPREDNNFIMNDQDLVLNEFENENNFNDINQSLINNQLPETEDTTGKIINLINAYVSLFYIFISPSISIIYQNMIYFYLLMKYNKSLVIDI